MYNLGVAWLYGFGGVPRDPSVAAQWFRASGLPEGLMALSLFQRSQGLTDDADQLETRARRIGFGSHERLAMRDQSGFALHNHWTANPDDGPPTW